MRLKLTPLTENLGAVVEPYEGKVVLPLSIQTRQEIIELFKLRGVLLFRGFNFDLQEFERFADFFGTSDAGFHPGLQGTSRDVFVGRAALGPHAELAYTPWPPDLLWFYCVHPAAQQGRTTLFDGIRFLSELDPATRDLFLKKKLLFSQFFIPSAWQDRYGKTQPEAIALLEPYGVVVEFKGPCLFTKYVVSAIRKTKFNGLDAFVNTVVHALDDPEFYGMTFEDGQPIPVEVENSLRAIATRVMVPLHWQSGDFVMVDNTRVMHGREAYEDAARLIKARHAMARFI